MGKRKREKIQDVTDQFYQHIYPSKEVLTWKPAVQYETNNIIQKTIIIYGKQGSGKSMTAFRIVEEAFRRYGQNEVYCGMSDNPLLLLDKGLHNSLCNILIFEDIT